MKILFLSHASLTTGFVVGSHQLARQFILQGHDVLHVSSPVSLVNLVKGKGGRAKLKTACYPPDKSEHWGFVDHIPILPFPYGYQHWLDKINNRFLFQFLKKRGWLEVDLVLVDQPLFHGLLPLINARKIIYRPTDLYADMGGQRFEKAEAEVFKYTASVIATSDVVLKNLEKYHPENTLVLSNGVDLEFFSGQSVNNPTANLVVRKGCVYVGAIDFRFDLDCAVALAKAHPDIAFDMYGPCTIPLPECLPNNFHLKGSVSYLELPALLRQYRVGLLPLNDHTANKGRSPMKLWEYAASGIHVLAKSFSNEINSFNGFLFYNDASNLIIKEFREFYLKDYEKIDLPANVSWKTIATEIMLFYKKI